LVLIVDGEFIYFLMFSLFFLSFFYTQSFM